MNPAILDGPTALYRFFDAADRLLYVGITVDIGVRWKHHGKGKAWWSEVVRATVAHYPNRDAALAAEKAAIKAEKPIWNIVHNLSDRPAAAYRFDEVLPSGARTCTFGRLESGHMRTTPLYLYWEVHCDPVSDHYDPSEISAEEMWDEWRTLYPDDKDCEEIYGAGTYSVWWSIRGHGVFERAPFQEPRPLPFQAKNFLDKFSWPEEAGTGDRLQWSALPVVDKLWRPDRADKGGFIQEATGWKPSPLQPYVNIHQLEAMSGHRRRVPA